MSSNNKMAIYPLESDYKLEHPGLFLRHLANVGFVSESTTSADSREMLLPGKLFMKHLTFLGCSPSVGSEVAGKSFNSYYIELITSNKMPVVIANKRIRAPECPGCRNRDKNGRACEQIRIEPKNSTWHCVNCGQHYAVTDIKWRHKLAVATDYIVVHGVFEGEVIPSDKFLDQLAGESGTSWSYCYF